MELEDGKTDLYFIPISMDVKDGAIIVQDALADEAVRAAWLDVIADGGEFVTEAGRIRIFRPPRSRSCAAARTERCRPYSLRRLRAILLSSMAGDCY